MPRPSPDGTFNEAWHIRLHDSPHDIDRAHWHALWCRSAQPTPFTHHAWLCAMHDTGCASPDTGWTPLFLSAHREPQAPPEAVCALYLKAHSYGEYVFDWAWANAYQQHGLRYYPKLLCAPPFSPVPGSRLLASSDEARQALLQGMVDVARQNGLSSAHLLFPDPFDLKAVQAAGWLIRQGVQFHWHNRQPSPYESWEDFTASLQREKRKKIQQERRKVRDAGVTVAVAQGPEITAVDWDFFYGCYSRTYEVRGNAPYLSRAFFDTIARTLPTNWLMFTAWHEGHRVAASLVAIDSEQQIAWGRYWGCVNDIPCLHFELCYYAPLNWCIEHGFHTFEGGAQGEHKMARGLMPVSTWSAHWLADARFSQAVEDFLAREGQGVSAYVSELNEHTPFARVPQNGGS